MFKEEGTLAERLGIPAHFSLLQRKLRRLMSLYPMAQPGLLEDWMLEVAKARGVKVVERFGGGNPINVPKEELSDEELVVGICLLQNLDRPQWLRAAAELVSRGGLDLKRLKWFAKLERVESVLGELANQALKVDPQHPAWCELALFNEGRKPLRDSLLHWTRIAEPVPQSRRVGVKEWVLPG